MDQFRRPTRPNSLKTCIKINQNIRLLTTNVKRVYNKVNKWRTYYVGRFIYKAITYEWLIITRNSSTCRQDDSYQILDKMNKPKLDIQAQVQNRKDKEAKHIIAKELILNDE